MGRRSFSPKDRARIFAANKGICHICNDTIDGVREAWEIEHVIPWALTRDDSDDNLRPAHKKCHREQKTGKDVADIARAKRREARYRGAKQPTGKLRSAGFKRKERQAKPPVAGLTEIQRRFGL